MPRWLLPVLALIVAVAALALFGWESAPPRPGEEPSLPVVTRVESPPRVEPRFLLPVADAGTDAGLMVADAGEDAGSTLVDAGLREVAAPADAGAVPEPVPTPLSFTVDAGTHARNDPRFTIRWGQAGLCGEEPLERLAQRRAALLASFTGVRRAGTLILHDPDAPLAFVDQVGDSLSQARIIVTRLLGPRADVALPVIYVYASGEQMRDVACVNTATAGYYDGAIHLPATDPDAHRTVVHEHVHHVLNALGLRKPMWLHEGLAMYAADERWWEDPRLGLTTWLRAKHLPFPALVEAFPHTADELFAGAAYYQSYQMVSFVAARSGRPDFSWLVEGLVSGTFSSQGCFGECVGLTGDQLESAWGGFMQSR